MFQGRRTEEWKDIRSLNRRVLIWVARDPARQLSDFPRTADPVACLKISEVPFRSELNRTILLSGVQEYGPLALSSSVSRLFARKCAPSGASVPM
jgi:hypothetical protein